MLLCQKLSLCGFNLSRDYLKEMDVVLCVGKFVQFSLVLLQLSDLPLDLLQQLLSLTDGHLFLGFDQLSHLKALQLDRPNQFGEDGIALLGCSPSSTLEGDTEQHILGATQDCCHKRVHRCVLAVLKVIKW